MVLYATAEEVSTEDADDDCELDGDVSSQPFVEGDGGSGTGRERRGVGRQGLEIWVWEVCGYGWEAACGD